MWRTIWLIFSVDYSSGHLGHHESGDKMRLYSHVSPAIHLTFIQSYLCVWRSRRTCTKTYCICLNLNSLSRTRFSVTVWDETVLNQIRPLNHKTTSDGHTLMSQTRLSALFLSLPPGAQHVCETEDKSLKRRFQTRHKLSTICHTL